MTETIDLVKCDDCKTLTDINLLDAWARTESQASYDALLCKSCHGKRPKSAWGAWEIGP
jgi:hypothetical protein